MENIKIVLLVTSKMNPIPSTIKVEENWGHIIVKMDDGEIIYGEHMYLSADSTVAFKDWLCNFDWVLVGAGNPLEQNFQIMHVKE